MERDNKRYIMNLGVLNIMEQQTVNAVRVLIVGLGGLGGNVANQLVRLGVRNLTLVDYDTFDTSNLNRQLFSKEENINQSKVEVVAQELIKIDSNIDVVSVHKKIQDYNPNQIDYIIDCVDNIATKTYLSKLSKELDIPLLHGSCGGWYGQVGWMSPNSTLIEDLYQNQEKGLEDEMFNPPFAPGVVASYMVSEFTKMIIKSKEVVLDELLLIDLLNNTLVQTGGNNNG